MPTPEWYRLSFETENDISGEVLASVSFVPLDKGPPKDPPSILPASADCTIDVVAIGLRDMTPVPLFGTLGNKLGLGNLGVPLVAPYIEFDVGDADTRKETKSSSSPSPSNANFLQKYTIPIQVAVYFSLTHVVLDRPMRLG